MQQIVQNDLLSWFDSDRKRLEEFRRRLVYWFGKQGVRTREECEDLAQKAFLRVMEKLDREPEISAIAPEQYISGVAKNVLKESRKRMKLPTTTPDPETIPDPDTDGVLEKLERERERKCLEKCLQNLKPDERELVELYAQSDSHYTAALSKKFGGTANALRIRIFRTIREKLRPCVENCLNF